MPTSQAISLTKNSRNSFPSSLGFSPAGAEPSQKVTWRSKGKWCKSTQVRTVQEVFAVQSHKIVYLAAQSCCQYPSIAPVTGDRQAIMDGLIGW